MTNSKSKGKDFRVPFQINSKVPEVKPTFEAPKVNQKVWAELNHQEIELKDLIYQVMNFMRENRVSISNLKGEITKVNKRIDEVVAKLLEGE